MADEIFKMGTLFISSDILHLDKWLQDQAISAAMSLLTKYKGQDGYLKSSSVRRGDFSLLLSRIRITPTMAAFIGIPGRAKSPIIEELFLTF